MEKQKALKTLCENIDTFSRRTAISKEQKALTAAHIASILCQTSDEESLLQLNEIYNSLIKNASGAEKTILCREMTLSKHLRPKILELLDSVNTDSAAGTHEKIAYVKNDLNNQAFEMFSKKIRNAKPVFEPSFTLACESVLDSQSEFCILPIENFSEGKLIGFYSLIDRYDLKINAVCKIEDDNSQTIVYALLGKCYPEIPEKSKNEKFIFEFSLLSQNGDFLNELLSAANECNATLEKVNFFPIHYDTKLRRYIFSFSIYGKDILTFRTFLTFNYNSYTQIGYYKEKDL